MVYPSLPPALFFDCTHDNEVPAQKRTAIDALPNAALVAMANCAIGAALFQEKICQSSWLSTISQQTYERKKEKL
jgi:glycogen debranching enzyme